MNTLLDFEALLKAIPGANPAGADLRREANSIYHQAKSAEYQARKAERKVFEGEETEPPDWGYILKAAPETLATKSKDIELAAWLAEALVRRHQFAGLRDGLKLIGLLIETYWDQGLHPDPRNYDANDRVRMLAALNGDSDRDGTLIRPIQQVPLTDDHPPLRAFSYWDYLEADRVAAIQNPEERRRQNEKGIPTPEQVAQAEQQTSPGFLAQTSQILAECLAELGNLDGLLFKKCRGLAPLGAEEIQELEAIAARLEQHADPVASLIWDRCSAPAQQLMSNGLASTGEDGRWTLAGELNALLEAAPLYEEPGFAGVELSAEARELLQAGPEGYGQVRLNRILLEDAFGLKRQSLAPSTTRIRQTLEGCRSLLVRKEAVGTSAGVSAVASRPAGNGGAEPMAQMVRRDEAFRQLLEIAKFFEATEPHSPISYSLRNIVRWGNLPLPALLGELIQDQGARSEVFRRVGIAEAPKQE